MRRFTLILGIAILTLSLSGCFGGRLTQQDVDATFSRLDEIRASTASPEEQWNRLVGRVVTEDFSVYADGAEVTFSETEKVYEIPSTIAGLVALKYMYEDAAGYGIQTSIDGNTFILASDATGGDTRLDFVRSGDQYLIKRVSTSNR